MHQLKHCSASIICAHSHPSGDSTLSPEDVI
ncbi:JAB domain-containing protein [Paenibacillus sp. DS2363]